VANANFLDFRSGGRLQRDFSAVYGRFTYISTGFSRQSANQHGRNGKSPASGGPAVITLGIDPGTALLGYGIVSGEDEPRLVTYGVVETTTAESMPARLARLYEAVWNLIRVHAPDVMAIEQLFFARNVTTALAVGQARGVVLLAAAQHGMEVFEYKPAEVKQTVAGYGKADKHQMQAMVRMQLDLDHIPKPDDAADALAVALCHMQLSRIARQLETRAL
jgi:crossover junction endodeoxyribonuclease RuvC